MASVSWTTILSLVLVSLVASLSEGGIDVDKEDDQNIVETKDNPTIVKTSKPASSIFSCSASNDKVGRCPSELECQDLGNECLDCQCDLSCRYGFESESNCTVPEGVNCTGQRQFKRKFTCSFCYQTNPSLHACQENTKCDSVTDPNKRNYIANCSVSDSTICFGRRHFYKQRPCNWTGGHRWLTTLVLSVTLGGFGADR